MRKVYLSFACSLVVGLFMQRAGAAAEVIMYANSIATNSIYEVKDDGTFSVFATGLNGPYGMAVDAQGNIFVANRGQPAISPFGGTTVSKVTPGGVVSTYATGLNTPLGVALDNAGNLFVSNYGTLGSPDGKISKIAPNSVVTTFVSGINGPHDLVFDNQGNLYAANYGWTNFTALPVSKITPGASVSVYGPTEGLGAGLAFDAAGNLYVTAQINAATCAIDRILPNGTMSRFATVFGKGQDLVFDHKGNLYCSDADNGTIWKISSQGVVTPFATGINGLAFMVAVPEPATLSFVAAGAVLLLTRRATRRRSTGQ